MDTAVHICRSIFDIQDEDVLNAVRYHTTGRKICQFLKKSYIYQIL